MMSQYGLLRLFQVRVCSCFLLAGPPWNSSKIYGELLSVRVFVEVEKSYYFFWPALLGLQGAGGGDDG